MDVKVFDDRYEILELVGGGGMAEVYKARDTVLNRVVALKIMHSKLAGDTDFVARFEQEAQKAAALSHPNIVGIYDVGVWEKQHYIVMEYVSNETLKKKLKAVGKLPLREALTIVKEIARALACAHAHNIIHCDIKPHNILITPEGQVKVADFGIARAVSSNTMTYNGTVIGSVHYFSPEQAKGTVITPKSDIYSLGVVLFELLTGELPFNGETTVSIALKHIDEEAPSVHKIDPEIPAVVDAVMQSLLNKQPEDRPDANELISSITRVEDLLYGDNGDDEFATQVISSADLGKVQERAAAEDDEEDEGLFDRINKKIAALFLLLVFFGFSAGAFFMFGKFWSPGEVTVPSVVGVDVADAKQTLADMKLRVKVEEIFDPKVPAGRVISQTPSEGSNVKEERTITLSVSKGGEILNMPDITGLKRNDAEDRLRKNGLKIGTIYEKVTTGTAGIVVEQSVTAGTKVAKGQVIDFSVSKRDVKKVKIPNFAGGTLEAAKATIAALNLTLGNVSYRESSRTRGTVIAQRPKAGSDVEEGSLVNLEVAMQKELDGEKEATPTANTPGGKTKGK